MTDFIHLPALIAEQLNISTSQARRLIAQGDVYVNGEPTEELDVPAEELKSFEFRRTP